MSQVEMNAYEAVLRMCADAAPNAWHPQQYARRSGTPLEQINAVLKELWQEGLLEKAPAHPDHGPGLRLSAKGWEVLNDPKALDRVRQGVTTDDDGERGELVRAALRRNDTSHVSRILVGMNVLVFLYGLYLANQARCANAYLGGGAAASGILHDIGLLTARDWLHGEWWKTLTACFVHIGVLHILMNMYMLYSCGQYIERIWGPVRFLVIYLLAGITGSMTGIAFNPGILQNGVFHTGGIAGASTALFGIFAAEGVWVLFNGKYLSKQVAREWRNHLLMNAVLLAFISFLPRISGWGHAGGAAAGAFAAVCLHYQRFGSPQWRWAALLGLLPIPFAGLYLIDYERHKQGAWQQLETYDFKESYPHSPKYPLTREMAAEFKDQVRPVLTLPPSERPADDKEAALSVLDKQRKALELWRAELTNLGPYDNPEVKAAQQQALDALTARLDLYARAEKSLREGEQYPEQDEKELLDLIAATPELQTREDRRRAEVKKRAEEREQPKDKDDPAKAAERRKEQQQEEAVTKFATKERPVIVKRLNKAQRLFDSELMSYLDFNRNRAEWRELTLKSYRAAIDTNREQLEQLVDKLSKLGPFPTEEIGTEVACARTYATALGVLLGSAKEGLLAGDKWTETEKAAFQKQRDKVKQLRSEWQEALP